MSETGIAIVVWGCNSKSPMITPTLLQTTFTYCAELPTSTGVPQVINH